MLRLVETTESCEFILIKSTGIMQDWIIVLKICTIFQRLCFRSQNYNQTGQPH